MCTSLRACYATTLGPKVYSLSGMWLLLIIDGDGEYMYHPQLWCFLVISGLPAQLLYRRQGDYNHL